jgi:hypothetical protein
MPIISNDSITGAVAAKMTLKGRQILLEEGRISVTRFRLFDNEVNYQLLNPDNIDQDDPDILAEAVFDGSPDDTATEYAFQSGKNAGILLKNPYFVIQQPTLIGNKISDNPLFAQNQEIVFDIGALTGDNSFLFGSQTSSTGNVVSVNAFYSIKVNITDQNGSAINGTNVSIYSNNAYTDQKTIKDNTFVIFSNLSSNQSYKIVVNNQAYAFQNSELGGGYWYIDKLQSNKEIKFIGNTITISAAALTLSGTLTNGISLATVSGVAVNLQYGNVLQSTSSNVSGQYSFTSLSSGINYFVSINNNSYYYSNTMVGLTGVLTASTAVNFTLYPVSQISGKVYYYNTTNPISNAVINLYEGTSAASAAKYILSVPSDKDGGFIFPNILLQRDYFIKAYINGYTFVNIPYQLSSSSVTASISSVVLYAKKDERPIQYDIPFPFRRRNIIDDKSFLPAFHNPCAWVFNSLKYGIVAYDASFNYSPIMHADVLRSNNYLDLINTLEGPFTFTWNSTNRTLSNFGTDSYSAYVSDNYQIKICLYALPYQYTLAESLPQWDVFSKDDTQSGFPQQVNPNAKNVSLSSGQGVQFIDLVPQMDNAGFSISINDVNKLSSLLPRTQLNIPVTISNNNAIPRLGLINPNTFNIDQSIMNVTLSPFEIATNSEYVTYASVKGQEKTVPVEVVVDDFENVSVATLQDQVNKQTFTISGVPLPIFIPDDSFLLNQYYSNNLAFTYNLQDFIQIIRNQGFIFDRVIQWQIEGNEYSVGRQSAYITINAFGATKTIEQLMFTTNGNHYQISQEFIQFLISYFGIPSSDQATINLLINNNSLVDWLFYAYIINFGAYNNAYSDGTLNQLLSLNKNTKFIIINDILLKGKNIVDVANAFVTRQYQPTQSSLDLINSFATETSQPPTETSPISGINGNQGKTVQNPLNGTTDSQQAVQNPLNGNQGQTAQNNGIVGINGQTDVFGNPNNLPVGGQNTQPFNPAATVKIDTPTIIKQQYAAVVRILSDAILKNTINNVLVIIYGFISFDYKSTYVIIIKSFNKVQVVNVVQKPIKTVKVITQNITPIVCRLINITNANNYFNLNPNVENKFKLNIKFDLSNPSTKDNFLKMINYLIDNLYVMYLGVEIIDNGNITKNLNAQVFTVNDYLVATEEVQTLYSQQDCVQFLIPMTTGGIKKQTNQVALGDPITFNGNGFIKLIPYSVDASGQNNPLFNVSHLLRIIKLSDVSQAGVELIDPSVISPNDYVAFDVLQINGTLDAQKIRRYLQYLDKYNYSLMNVDLNDLRKILLNEYSGLAGITYVGSYGAAFASSTQGPNFWNSSIFNWQNGTSALAMIQNILTLRGDDTAKTMSNTNVGQVITNVNDFKL